LIGIEANYFFLAERQSDVSFSSDGDPVLAQSFINAVSRTPDATVVAAPGIAVGKVAIETRVGLLGGRGRPNRTFADFSDLKIFCAVLL
jgi:hypothetical protein